MNGRLSGLWRELTRVGQWFKLSLKGDGLGVILMDEVANHAAA